MPQKGRSRSSCPELFFKPPGGQPPVLLTAIDVRRYVRKLIETEFPDIAVISYQEVLPEIRIQPLGRIQIF